MSEQCWKVGGLRTLAAKALDFLFAGETPLRIFIFIFSSFGGEANFGHTFFFSGLGTGLDGRNTKKKLKRKGLVGWFTWAGLIFGVLIYLLHSLFSISVSIYSGRFASKASEVGKKKFLFFGRFFF